MTSDGFLTQYIMIIILLVLASSQVGSEIGADFEKVPHSPEFSIKIVNLRSSLK